MNEVANQIGRIASFLACHDWRDESSAWILVDIAFARTTPFHRRRGITARRVRPVMRATQTQTEGDKAPGTHCRRSSRQPEAARIHMAQRAMR
ncbi:hypothetical protein MRX96_054627 [Rhipicephalus microplus]